MERLNKNGERDASEAEETPLEIGVLPVAGAFAASTAGGIGVAQSTTGASLTGTALYAVTSPFNDQTEESQNLADRAESALAEDGRLSAHTVSQIHISLSNGVVELTGRVGSETEREIAQHICAPLSGVRGVENRLVVTTD